jgi:hypothetical protein
MHLNQIQSEETGEYDSKKVVTMKTSDVKSLWGRAANRCSFTDCKIELTPDGAKETLGEMAHIIAKSPDGPRGKSDIPPESRDSYENLILLCPTHHKIVDKDPEKWTVDILKQMKEKHEKWVIEQLEKGDITTPLIDNSDFLNKRKIDWFSSPKDKDYVWIISSITPLNISKDVINNLEDTFSDVLNNLELPDFLSPNSYVDKSDTRPNEYGIGNENLRNIQHGSGYRVHIFRNGHCEFSICLGYETNNLKDSSGKPFDGKVLFYSDMGKCFYFELNGLNSIWKKGLPFKDMLLTTMIINTKSTCLNYEQQNYPIEHSIGPKISSNELKYNTVISKTTDMKSIQESVIKRFVRYFGLVLENLYDENGNIVKPRKLSF